MRENIFGAELAENGDLSNNSKKTKFGKTIDSVLRNARQALKAVKVLHDQGYSHNDIKPSNFLKINNSEFNKAKAKTENFFGKEVKFKINKEGKEKKLHKHKLQLGDFGLMSKIDSTTDTSGTPDYMAPDIKNTSPEAVAKRDVYSLGVTFIYLLFCKGKYKNAPGLAEFLRTNTAQLTYEKSDLEKLYPGTCKENVVKFLKITTRIRCFL